MLKIKQTVLTKWLLFLLIQQQSSIVLCEAQWQYVHNVTKIQESQSNYPGIRYSHATALFNNQMIITHGYFYDRGNRQPRWLSDTWGMDLTPPHNWHFLHDHADEINARNWYQNNQRKFMPAGRFGLTSVVLNLNVQNNQYQQQQQLKYQYQQENIPHLFIFGGSDGGYFRHGQKGYKRGYEINEIWKFNLNSLEWSEVEFNKNLNPGGRHLHAMAGLNEKIYVFGGLGENKGDLWEFNINNQQWKQIAEQQPGPGSRVGARMVTINTSKKQGLLVFGGRVQLHQNKSVILPDDVWWFDLKLNNWQKINILSDQRPAGRMYHGMTTGTNGTDGIVYLVGGSLSSPSMKCTDETWAFVLDCEREKISGKWIQLNSLPFGHYFVSIVVGEEDLFTFGGHVCSSTKGDLPYFYLNSVLKMGVKEFREKQKSCTF